MTTNTDTEQACDSVAIPDFYPPYEEPFEMLFGCHFDNSIIKRRAYQDDGEEYMQNHRMRSDFDSKMVELGARVCINYVRGLTGAARYANQPATPPFFEIIMYEPYDTTAVRNVAIEVVKKHYPNEDDPIFRFYAGTYDVDFASETPSGNPASSQLPAGGGTKAAASTPALNSLNVTAATPDSAEDRFKLGGEQLNTVYSDARIYDCERTPVFYGREKLYNKDEGVVGMSIGLHTSHRVGTAGPAFFLEELDTNNIIKDCNGNKQLFTITSHHVLVQGTDKLDRQDAEKMHNDPKQKTIVSHLGRADREDTLYHRRRRNDEYERFLTETDKHPRVGSKQFKAKHKTEQIRIKDDRYVYPSVQQQLAEDRLYQLKNVVRAKPIGELYCASGKRNAVFEPVLGQFTNKLDPIAVDYAIVKIYPEAYGRFNNVISSSVPWVEPQRGYPQDFDFLRAHRRILKIDDLRPDEVVINIGRTTLMTFGYVEKQRERVRLKSQNRYTHECSVRSTTPGTAFAFMGDSGGPVINKHGAWVGMITAGKPKNDSDADFATRVTPLQVVVADMAKEFKLKPHLYRPHDDGSDDQLSDQSDSDSDVPAAPSGHGGKVWDKQVAADGSVAYKVRVKGEDKERWIPESAMNSSRTGAVKDYNRLYH
ncbi:hypothetical protein HII31_00094 [Pseudocercospora fuligena]|uniref:Peptidase S1 domain-containing protein n=1 Tax=Pseudocercospora fuligena TaxID=685502 RepID=A0A8H6VNI3_9PEZI|nr:hypothetical protein HII31_00094 [Pseudocercospora fuligena]